MSRALQPLCPPLCRAGFLQPPSCLLTSPGSQGSLSQASLRARRASCRACFRSAISARVSGRFLAAAAAESCASIVAGSAHDASSPYKPSCGNVYSGRGVQSTAALSLFAL